MTVFQVNDLSRSTCESTAREGRTVQLRVDINKAAQDALAHLCVHGVGYVAAEREGPFRVRALNALVYAGFASVSGEGLSRRWSATPAGRERAKSIY